MSADRSRELQLATRRAAEAEQARQQAHTGQQAAAEKVAALEGSWLRRRELAAARERLVLAEHALKTTSRQADQAAERLGILRRAQQRHLGWLEAHDSDLRPGAAVAREDAWRRRVDQHALALDPPGLAAGRARPVPTDPSERAVWRLAAAELDGYRRAYGLDHPGPAKHRWGRMARDGRDAAPSEQVTAWRRGAAGERRTARLLDRLTRDGYVVFHDLALPGSLANVDHLVIGPSGVFVIDSKQWTGSVRQSADGLVWHNHYRLDRSLEVVCWEAQVVGRLLGARTAGLVCVHGAHVHGGGLDAQGVAIVPAHLLRSALGYDRVLSDIDVAVLATTAWTSLRPAA